MEVADAFELLDEIEHQAQLANKRADTLKERKAQAKKIALDVLDIKRQKGARIEGHEGRDVQYTPYDFDVFNVVDHEAFGEWAETADESFYDTNPRLRGEVFQGAMRQLHQDKQPLPPGVQRYSEVRLSRTAVAQRRKTR